jgi:hypothetical protein
MLYLIVGYTCRSAAEQLLGLSQDPTLLTHICQPSYLRTILGALTWQLDQAAPPDGAPPTAAALNSLDIPLPVAAANLLFACVSGSPAARLWVLGAGPDGGLLQLQRALPLLFHSLLTMRRAAGRLVGAVVLGAEADKWPAWGQHSSTLSAEMRTQVGMCVTGYEWYVPQQAVLIE